jgi:protease-4
MAAARPVAARCVGARRAVTARSINRSFDFRGETSMRSFMFGMWAAIAIIAISPAGRLTAAPDDSDSSVATKEKADSKSADAKDEAKAEKAKAEQARLDKAKAEKEAKEKAAKEAAANKDSKEKKTASKKVRLAHIRIEGALPESPGEMSLFGDLGVDLRKTIARIEKAGADKSVAGIVLEIDSIMGSGKLNELRGAINRVQADGKKVYAYLESAYGPQYLLAAACDEVVMPESGEIIVPGIRFEFTFYKDLLAKLGIEADMMHVGDYKGAAEAYTRDSLSEPVRKNLTAMIDDMFDDMVTTIAADRNLQVEDVRKLINQGLISATDARDGGLIDSVAYPDQFRAALGKEYNADKLVYVLNYAKAKVDADFSGPMGMMKLFQTVMAGDKDGGSGSGAKIAVIYAVGPIMRGESQSGLFGDNVMGSATIVKAFRDAAEDEDVKAIVLRVDSPGGSALASDVIWRQTQAIDKPIIASMGDIAASGGYYISMGADRIFAEPGTITGSIGVVGGKLAMNGLYDKLGMDTEVIARGENSGILSSTSKFTPSERAEYEKLMKDVYGQFTAKAAKGRDMKLEDLEKLAGGQVYTGRAAKRNGLVDEIGTLRDAIQASKRLAGLDANEKVELKVLPEPKNPLESLFGADMDAEREAQLQALNALAAFAPELRGALRHVAHLRQIMQEPVALVMPYWFEVK